MIVVDTSALMAVVLKEAKADICSEALETASALLISAGTYAEVQVVAGQRGVLAAVNGLIEDLNFTVAPVTASFARRVGRAYARWGKGVHPAGLNFGDCFAYALAEERDCPLLYVGDDFAKTDLKPLKA